MASSRRTEYEIAMLVGGQVQTSFGNSIDTVNDGFNKVASMAETAAKVAAAAFGAVKVGQFVSDSIEVYSEFEQAMANTAATANATQLEYEQLEAAARAMGKATTKTATEAADALGYMMLAGWSVSDSIAGLEPVLRLSEATQMDLATCSDLVTDSMSALGLSVDKLSGYLDICTKANNNANTTAEALMEAFIGCGGAAKTIGADLNDTATALGILANNGTKGAEAGTALNSMLVRMTSKDAAIKAMKDLGVSAFDASGNFIGLQNVLVKVQRKLADLSTEEQASYMSKIAGTNYYTEMSYLLDAVADSSDGAVSAWDELSGKLEESDGALMNMADRVTDTLGGAFARLDSAVDDAKISFADAFSGDLKDVINDMAGYIPTLTDKFIEFSTKAGPKISRTFQMVKKGAGEVWDVVSGMGGWMIDNFDTMEKVLAGVGGAIVAYKLVSGLMGAAQGIKAVGLAIKAMTVTNPWLLGITLAISAIVGIASAIKTAERQAVKSNLAAHFGDIALSMEDISKVAEHIVMNEYLSQIQQSLAAFGELEGIQKNIRGSIDAINKMNWKVSIGMKLSEDERDTYATDIQSYVSSVQEYVQQQQYALNLNLAPFAEGDLERQNIVDQLNAFYADKYSELEEIGARLNETVTAAFEDGLLDMDEVKEITELQAQMARIQEAIATSDFDAKLKVMELQYSGKDLDADSFKALQAELAAQAEAAAADYEESLTLRIANTQVMLDDGAITQAEFDAAVNEYWEDYLTSVSSLEAKTLNFQTNTIAQQYEAEIDAYMQSIQDIMADYSSYENIGDWNEKAATLWLDMAEEMVFSLSKDTRGAIAELLEAMQPSMEQIETLKKQYAELGMDVPKSLYDAMGDTELFRAMAGESTDSLYYVLGQAMAGNERYSQIISMLEESGGYVPEALSEGIKDRMEETLAPAVDGLYQYTNEYLQEVFSPGFSVSTDVAVRMKTSRNSAKSSEGEIDGHAEGGIFNTPHIAWFAEDGPEAAIPLDGSSNAISLWEKVGRLLGVLDGGMSKSLGDDLYGQISGYQEITNSTAENKDMRQFVFSPQVHVDGNADEETISRTLRMSMEEFTELIEEYFAGKGRVSLAHA